MTCELITGTAGSEHISSADDGSMFASVFGPGRYAVKQGNDLAATIVDANNVQIGTGAGFLDGRYWRVTSADTVSIDSGAQGMNRIDLIGVKYEYDSGTGAETCTLAVVKGTATSGDPSVPTYTDGNVNTGASEAYFPLYSVTITGVTPATPVKLFKTLGTTVSCPWPVGAVLQMTNGNDPNDAYPGTTWSQIQGKFLLGASSGHTLGTTGGAESVTLTAANLPSNYASFSIYPGAGPNTGQGNSNVTLSDYTASSSHGFISTNGSTTTMKKVTLTGSGTAVNKMPPFKVVNMWERTA